MLHVYIIMIEKKKKIDTSLFEADACLTEEGT